MYRNHRQVLDYSTLDYVKSLQVIKSINDSDGYTLSVKIYHSYMPSLVLYLQTENPESKITHTPLSVIFFSSTREFIYPSFRK